MLYIIGLNILFLGVITVIWNKDTMFNLVWKFSFGALTLTNIIVFVELVNKSPELVKFFSFH